MKGPPRQPSSRARLVLLVVGACARREVPGGPEAAPVDARTADALDSGSSAVPTATPSALATDRPATCRALAVEGDVRVVEGEGGTGVAAVAVGSRVPAGSRVELGPEAQVTLRSPSNGREWSLHGPARANVCRAGGNAVATDTELFSGGFASSPGSGEAPGEEAWVVTPFGVVRYAVSALRVTVASNGAELRVERGAAYAFVAPGRWLRVGEGGELHLGGTRAAWPTLCAEAAARVSALRTELTAHAASPDAAGDASGSTFASLSAESVTAAERRRAACAVARMIASAR